MRSYHVCTVQPDGYEHHHAFDELVELLRLSIAELGTPCSASTNFLSSHRTNIIVGGHLMSAEMRASVPRSSIIVNTEPLFSRQNSDWTERMVNLARLYRIWDYNERNIDRLNELGARDVHLLRIGYQPELARIPRASNPDIDVLFYGSINDRRNAVIQQLRSRGLNIVPLYGVYGRERDGYIARSKVVLNMHYYDQNIFEVVRVFYLLTNAKTVVAEIGTDTSVEDRFLSALAGVSYDKLADTCHELARNQDKRHQLERCARFSMTSWAQTKFMKPLLNP